MQINKAKFQTSDHLVLLLNTNIAMEEKNIFIITTSTVLYILLTSNICFRSNDDNNKYASLHVRGRTDFGRRFLAIG